MCIRTSRICFILLAWTTLYTVESQQGQNYYLGNGNVAGSGRLIQFASPQHQQHAASLQSFPNFFPRTNGGPFSPFRGTAPSYQVQDVQQLAEETLPTPAKYHQNFSPQQQFISQQQQPPIYQLPQNGAIAQSPGSQVRYIDPSILSPVATGFSKQQDRNYDSFLSRENYQSSSFEDSRSSPAVAVLPTSSPRHGFEVNRAISSRTGNLNRYQGALAFSEVNRSPSSLESSRTVSSGNSDRNNYSVQPEYADEINEESDNGDVQSAANGVIEGQEEEQNWHGTGFAEPAIANDQNQNYHQNRARNSPYSSRGRERERTAVNRQTVIADPTTENGFLLLNDNDNSRFHQKSESQFSAAIGSTATSPGAGGSWYGNKSNAGAYIADSNNNGSYSSSDGQLGIVKNRAPVKIKASYYHPSSTIAPSPSTIMAANSPMTKIKTSATTPAITTGASIVVSVATAAGQKPNGNAIRASRNRVNKPRIEPDRLNNEAIKEELEDGNPAGQSDLRGRINVSSSQQNSPASVYLDIVTMNHDHRAFVSEDNFKGFVDSAVIDRAETPSTEESSSILEDLSSTVVTIPAKHSTIVKKTLSPELATSTATNQPNNIEFVRSSDNFNNNNNNNNVNNNGNSNNSTDSWIVVSSVQTSRSVSGTRYLPQSLKSQARTTNSTTKSPTTRKSITATHSTENIIDKLDQVQSDLSSAILDGGFPSPEKLTVDVIPDIVSTTRKSSTVSATSTTVIPSTTTTTTTSTTAITSTVATTSSNISPNDNEETSNEENTSSFTRKFAPTTKRPKSNRKSPLDNIQFEEVTNLLPPDYKHRGFTPKISKFSSSTSGPGSSSSSTPSTTVGSTEKTVQRQSKSKPEDPLSGGRFKFKFDDVSSLLPADYKAKITAKKNDSSTEQINEDVRSEEEEKAPSSTTTKPNTGVSSLDAILSKIQFKETNELLPSDYQQNISSSTTTTTAATTQTTEPTTAVVKSAADSKVVFPSRPGGSASNKKPPSKSSSSKTSIPSHQIPHIQKGWPVRSSTEFHGWSVPSPSPIPIEKIIQAAKEAHMKESSSASSAISVSTESTTPVPVTTTTTQTTTAEPTTPGICSEDCKLAGSIKLVDGVKWVPELLDHNTKEWQTLAKEVESQLQAVYYMKEPLNHWCKGITIDAFSQGSVIVDYFVELNDLGHTVNTAEMKNIFNKALRELDGNYIFGNTPNRSQHIKLGRFTVDPASIDFFVLPKSLQPAIGMAEQDMWLPQWAIAVIVIGIASLLFVVIFGITILVNKQKNALKHPTALTEDMLNELNKNHMSGFDNYGVDDLYNMEDVWNEKPFKKRNSYYHDGSAPNIYDSWRSDWNGYYGNSYYNSSTHSGYSRRRSDYDTNF